MGALPPSTSPLTATETFRPAREKVTESPPTLWPAEAAKTPPPDCGRFGPPTSVPRCWRRLHPMIPHPSPAVRGIRASARPARGWYVGVILPAVPVGVVIGL